MRKLVIALLLVVVLLSLFAGVALATCPEYEDGPIVAPTGVGSLSTPLLYAYLGTGQPISLPLTNL